MPAKTYFDQVRAALDAVEQTQAAAIRAAAERMIDAVVRGRALYAFGATHSFIIAQEMVYRTGGLMLVNPIYPHGMDFSVRPLPATSQMERTPGLGATLLDLSPAVSGDVLLIASTSGRNAVVIDMALRARDKGIAVVGITALAYTRAVASRHPSGKKLVDLCDVVIDNGAPYGDAAVEVPGFAQKVAPLSSVTGCAIANALVAEVVEGLVARGHVPPVFMSANLDGGDAFNRRLLAENRERIHYL
ncbi:MAG: sugar isomerase domain-containing protein [Kiritimatiellia bacterium]